MISDVYFPRINGVSTSIKTFTQEFRHRGHDVTLIVPAYPDTCSPAGLDSEDHLDLIRIPSRTVPFDAEDRMMHLPAILKLAPDLQRTGFDLIHVHTPFVAHYAGVKLSRRLNLPLIITYHTLFEEYLFHYIPFLPRALLKAIARRFSRAQCNDAEALIAPSRVIVELLRRYGVKRDISVIPTGIHCEDFTHGGGEAFRRRFDIAADRPVLLNVSRVAFEKNIGMLLQVLQRLRQQLPEVLLVIAGEGPAKVSYQAQARRLGLDQHVLFVGYLDRAGELIDCYASADAFVFASKTETQGLVLLEAMAAGTPVVSLAAMGTRDILEDCDGAEIVADDVEEFSSTLLGLLQDRERLNRLKQAAVTSAAQWDARPLAQRMLDFYDKLLRQHSRAPVNARHVESGSGEVAKKTAPAGKAGA